MTFSTVDPRDVILFCEHQAQQGMPEALRDLIKRQYALALYATAKGRSSIRIYGSMRALYLSWLKL